MAGTSLLALIDDIATILDDISVMTKVAAKKTAGVLGDDLALNAEKVTGVAADRELPVVWAVTKGATLNKVILIPAALLISAVASFMITPLLMLGGGFLCYEGFHKVFHKLFHKDEEHEKQELVEAFKNPEIDMVEFEKEKIKGAIRTDFILSAEIIVIALGTVAEEPFITQLAVLTAIGIGLNFVVYGLVAGIVKLDDVGLALANKEGGISKVGDAILFLAPWLMKTLSVVGTAAMFLVGGGIIAHSIHQIADLIHVAEEASGALAVVVPTLLNGVVGIITGGLISGVVAGAGAVIGAVKGDSPEEPAASASKPAEAQTADSEEEPAVEDVDSGEEE